MAEKMARLGATAFAVGLLLAGPQAAGVAVADRGEAGASASDDTRGSASDDDSADVDSARSKGPKVPSEAASEDESDDPDVEVSVEDPDVEVSVEDPDVDVEASVDDPDLEIAVDEALPSPGEPEIPPIDDTGEDTPAEDPITESPVEDLPADPIAEESTDLGDPAGDDPSILEDPVAIEDGIPGRGGAVPLPWYRTTTVEDGLGTADGPDSENPEVVWNYSGPSDDDLFALPVAVPGVSGEYETPEPLAGTVDGPAGQAIATLKIKVVEALDLALNWLSGLPSTRFTEFLSGALLLVRRTLLPDADIGQDTGGPGATEPATELPEGLVGLSEAAAVDAAESGGWVARVVARDGEYFPVTLDYSTSRVNLTLVSGIVTSVSVG
jgi:hypothetical protein